MSQETFLFHDTIRANIAFANPKASAQQVKVAAAAAYADEFIERLPEGYETRVGEHGVLLSGGQRQRLAIARAILADPEILVFDEAASSLDAASERIVRAAVARAGKGKTVLVISHNLSSVEDADRLIVIERGRIVEAGAHEALLRQKGAYYRSYALQFGNGTSPVPHRSEETRVPRF